MASFVGTLNLLDAKVVDAGAGRLAVDGQEIRTDKPITAAGNGGTVGIALRPEAIDLGEPTDGQNRLRGTVDDISFLGSIVRIRMRLGDSGPSISMDTFNDPHLQLPGIGEIVSASFPSTAMLVLERPAAAVADEVAAAEA